MDAELGTIIRIEGNKAWVEIPRSKACSVCKACVPLDGKESMSAMVINDCNAIVGDKVELAEGKPRELVSSLLLYGLPLVCFVAFLLLGIWLFSELAGFLCGLGALVLSYLAVYFISKKMDHEPYLRRAVKVVKE